MSEDTVTISKKEHRRLLVAAREMPDGMFLRPINFQPGLGPNEVRTKIDTDNGPVFCTMGERSIVEGHISIGWPVGRKPDYVLVELPRETDAGHWRVWVRDGNVVSLDTLFAPSLTHASGSLKTDG